MRKLLTEVLQDGNTVIAMNAHGSGPPVVHPD